MVLHPPLFDFPGRENPAHKAAVWGVLFFSLAHVAATWGHIGLFWGDCGRWLNEVARFAQGETPYRDYSWAFPPLALWLLGGIAKIFGSGVIVIWTTTSIVCVLIFLAYYGYVSLLIQRPFVPAVLASGFLLSTAYANRWSAPLPAGMYIPAAPVGFLCLVTAALCGLNLLRSPRLSYAVGLGTLCALAVLAKQDFWLPSLYLMALSSGVLLGARPPQARVCTLALLIAFGLTVLIGVSVVAMQCGWGTVAGIPGGFGQWSEFRGRRFPSGERITIEATALALLVLAVIACLAVGKTVSLFKLRVTILVMLLTAVLGSALDLSMTYRIGLRVRADGIGPFPTPMEEFLWGWKGSLSGAAVHWLKQRLPEHRFPALLPAALALMVAACWKRLRSAQLRNTVIVLLGLCITARSGRGFEYVEWYHFLLEIPCYVLAIQLIIPDFQRRRAGLAIALFALVLMGMRSYWSLAVGPFTASRAFQRIDTPKGSVYLSGPEARLYRKLYEILIHLDPSGKRPVFAFGYSGGFNYFLDRPNPTPLTLGFLSTQFSPDKVVSDLLASSPRPFLLDNAAFHPGPGDPGTGRFPSPRIDLRRWELPMTESHYSRLDRPYFARLISACKMVSKIPKTPVTVYDCNVCRMLP